MTFPGSSSRITSEKLELYKKQQEETMVTATTERMWVWESGEKIAGTRCWGCNEIFCKRSSGVILLEALRPTILQSATTLSNSLPICAKSTRNLSCTGSSKKGQRRRSGRGLVFSSFFLLVCLMLLLVHFLLFADFWLIHWRFYFLKMKMKKARYGLGVGSGGECS
jgi:hypothetical protein